MFNEIPFCFTTVNLPHKTLRINVPIKIESKGDLISFLDNSLEFPDYFGGNWDALEECLNDLSWMEPGAIAIVHQDLPLKNDRFSLKIYLDILKNAVINKKLSLNHEIIVIFPLESKSIITSLLEDV